MSLSSGLNPDTLERQLQLANDRLSRAEADLADAKVALANDKGALSAAQSSLLNSIEQGKSESALSRLDRMVTTCEDTVKRTDENYKRADDNYKQAEKRVLLLTQSLTQLGAALY